jgi:formate hydrogenlyase subunit 3/multisubunit Na+/H+ antiporter MnhD subunit
MALVVSHRFGAVPLHARVSRLADAAPSSTLPILAAWLPAAWGLVILGWAPAALGPSAAALGLERGLIVMLAITTLLLGTVAALIQDEVEHVIAYTIVADAGVALLALAALDPAARDAARAWVLVYATTRTAMIGWTIAFRAAFGTGRLRDTGGWLRRAPALGVALAGILVGVVGWPGLLAWDARLAILQSATAGPALFLAYAGSLGTGIAICRLLVVGAGRPSAIVAGAIGELPRLPVRPMIEGAGAASAGPRRVGVRATASSLRDRLRGLAAALGRDARPSLELNRVPLRAFVVILLAGLALLTAVGAFGIDAAARATGPALPSLAPLVGG